MGRGVQMILCSSEWMRFPTSTRTDQTTTERMVSVAPGSGILNCFWKHTPSLPVCRVLSFKKVSGGILSVLLFSLFYSDVPTESQPSTSPFISSLSLSSSEENIGKKLLRKLSEWAICHQHWCGRPPTHTIRCATPFVSDIATCCGYLSNRWCVVSFSCNLLLRAEQILQMQLSFLAHIQYDSFVCELRRTVYSHSCEV